MKNVAVVNNSQLLKSIYHTGTRVVAAVGACDLELLCAEACALVRAFQVSVGDQVSRTMYLTLIDKWLRRAATQTPDISVPSLVQFLAN